MKMRNRHVTRFGAPLTSSGAVYGVSDEEGLFQMYVDLELEHLKAKGIHITSEIKSELKSDIKRKQVEYHDKVKEFGIPEIFKNLFLMNSKTDVEKYTRKIMISEYDLFLLIHNCIQIRLTHRSKFKLYIPDHLKLSNSDRDEIETGNTKRMVKKLHSGLIERKYIHVHLFEHSSDWHCFYFTHQDIDPTANHWKYGCHLHYISHLWPQFRKRWIWNKFNQRSIDISGSLHMRFEPFEFPKPDEDKNYDLNMRNSLPPWTAIFDSKFAGGCGSKPLPMPHVATRGMWFLKVFLPFNLFKK
jgi:hypothetical protein